MTYFVQDEHDDRIRLQHLMMGEFGFDRLTPEIYEALLRCGPLPRRQLLAILSQSHTRLDSGLAVLRDHNLVSVDYERFQPRYYAINPAVAWQALRADILWKTLDTMSPAESVLRVDHPAVETLLRTCADLAGVGGRLYRHHIAALEHRQWDAAAGARAAPDPTSHHLARRNIVGPPLLTSSRLDPTIAYGRSSAPDT
ncbi:MAG: hypothetical protein AUG03_08810 [Acidobacteria bacterium 13_1_20CM_2_68_14]|nr:MAG: hypothetical protein AUG03_08810 [Acidobacteria bacterium 13_1_20CM_2_68_14]